MSHCSVFSDMMIIMNPRRFFLAELGLKGVYSHGGKPDIVSGVSQWT